MKIEELLLEHYRSVASRNKYRAEILRLVADKDKEISRLRTLVRCELIEPPFDVTDDMTTQFAVDIAGFKYENTELTQRIAELEAQLKEFETILINTRNLYSTTIDNLKCCGNCKLDRTPDCPKKDEWTVGCERCDNWQSDNLKKEEREK